MTYPKTIQQADAMAERFNYTIEKIRCKGDPHHV